MTRNEERVVMELKDVNEALHGTDAFKLLYISLEALEFTQRVQIEAVYNRV